MSKQTITDQRMTRQSRECWAASKVENIGFVQDLGGFGSPESSSAEDFFRESRKRSWGFGEPEGCAVRALGLFWLGAPRTIKEHGERGEIRGEVRGRGKLTSGVCAGIIRCCMHAQGSYFYGAL